MTTGSQFALSEFYPQYYTSQKADCGLRFSPERAPIITVTISGTVAVTAAAGTSAVSAREVYQATSAATATAGTSAVSSREKYQATSSATATAATSAVASREKYTATSGATATAGTCAAVSLEDDQGTCACTGSAGTCSCHGTQTSGVVTPVDTQRGGVVTEKTLEKFRKHYASVKGFAKLKPKRKARHKARGRQLILASAELIEEDSQQKAFGEFIALPVFTAAAELEAHALMSSARGGIRIAGASEIAPPRPMIDDDDIAILMLLAA